MSTAGPETTIVAPRFSMLSSAAGAAIRAWLRLFGRRVRKADAPRLAVPAGGDRIGEELYARLAEKEGLRLAPEGAPYLRTLRESFHVYVDPEGTLRTDHRVHFMGLPVLKLHYKITRLPVPAGPV